MSWFYCAINDSRLQVRHSAQITSKIMSAVFGASVNARWFFIMFTNWFIDTVSVHTMPGPDIKFTGLAKGILKTR